MKYAAWLAIASAASFITGLVSIALSVWGNDGFVEPLPLTIGLWLVIVALLGGGIAFVGWLGLIVAD